MDTIEHYSLIVFIYLNMKGMGLLIIFLATCFGINKNI